MGQFKGSGDGAGREIITVFLFSPPPPPFPSFALAPTVRVTISTLPNLPLSENQRWRLQQYYEHETRFCPPKIRLRGTQREYSSKPLKT